MCMTAVRTGNDDKETLSSKLERVQGAIFERMKEVLREAHEKMRSSAMNEGGKQVPGQIKEMIVEEIGGKEQFKIVIEGATFYSSDPKLVELGKERMALKAQLEIAEKVNSGKLD